MPRAKVRDEDRQRAAKACVPCKSSKIRCDGKSPCSTCVRRKCSSSCKYFGSRTSKGRRNQRQSQASDPITHQTPVSIQTTPSSFNETHGGGESAHRASYVESEAHEPDGEVQRRSPEATRSRMMLNSEGEKVYIGKIASLSLLQFLRQTLRFYMGPSSFTESVSNIMLEAEFHDSRVEDFGSIDILQEQSMVHTYFEASSGFLDLYTKDEVLGYLAQRNLPLSNSKSGHDDSAALCLVLAIGGQSRGQSQSHLQFAASNFAKGRKLAFQGMLSDPSINMIRLFLLLAFYMLGACRRNAAFMYLGVASKAACALGLHSRSQSSRLTREERNLRKRVWKSLSVLDIIVNSILGRPSLLPTPRLESEEVEDDRVQYPTGLASTAAYGACSHLFMIVCKLSESNDVDSNFTEQFLQKLDKWAEMLPAEQRKFTTMHTSLLSLTNRELLIGNTHVACIYYFAVILVTRPFLMSYLAAILQARAEQGGNGAAITIPKDERVETLAQVCLNAARYMTQLCHKVMESDGLLSNMCILKALMFAAGLLLGFASFVQGKESDTEDSFRASVAVLRKFSDLSPQARLYCEILNDFGDAIATYQQHLAQQRRRPTNQYVKQLFTIEIGQNESTNIHAPVPGFDGIPENHAVDSTWEGSYADGGILSPGTLLADDTMNMPLLWDDFNLEW